MTTTTQTKPTHPYRVWWIPQVPGKPFTIEVPDLATAVAVTATLEQYDLFQYENRIKPDYANAGGVQKWFDGPAEDQGWYDMDDDELPEPGVKALR
jgi:hypothetical protein